MLFFLTVLSFFKVAAPMWQVDKALVDLQSEAEDAGDDELASILEPIIATHRGAYELVNEQRALVVQRARAIASGEEYDKAELKFIENSFATRDDPAGDVPAELARLRRRFAHESRKADRHSPALALQPVQASV